MIRSHGARVCLNCTEFRKSRNCTESCLSERNYCPLPLDVSVGNVRPRSGLQI